MSTIKSYKKVKLENPISKNEYYKRYYAENKERLLREASRIVQCPLCNRNVKKDYLKTHQTKEICIRNRAPAIQQPEQQIEALIDNTLQQLYKIVDALPDAEEINPIEINKE